MFQLLQSWLSARRLGAIARLAVVLVLPAIAFVGERATGTELPERSFAGKFGATTASVRSWHAAPEHEYGLRRLLEQNHGIVRDHARRAQGRNPCASDPRARCGARSSGSRGDTTEYRFGRPGNIEPVGGIASSFGQIRGRSNNERHREIIAEILRAYPRRGPTEVEGSQA